MGARAIAGEDLNQLATALSVVGTTEDSLFPASYLYDYRTDRPFRWTSAVVDQAVTVDRAMWANGNLEAWSGGVPTGFSKTGTVAQDGTNMRGGAACANLSAGATLQRERKLRAGDTYIVAAWAKQNGAGGTGKLWIYNPDTGHYYSSGAWGSTVAAAASAALTASYVDFGAVVGPFAMEGFSACLAPRTTLRIWFEVTGGAAYLDDVDVWPRHTWTSLHGHNIAPGVALQVRQSSDNFSGSDVLVATLTGRRYACGAHHAANDLRYARLKLATLVNPTTPEIAELVMGQDLALASPALVLPSGPWTSRHRQLSSEGAVYSLTASPTRDVDLRFIADTEAKALEIEQELRERMLGALWPLVIQPAETSRPDLLFFGRGDPEWSWSNAGGYYQHQLRLRGEPLPAQVA